MEATLITCFEVPDGREEEFLDAWRPLIAHMSTQPGYIDHALHFSAPDEARYRFINVAHWTDAESLRAALHSDKLGQLLARPEMSPFPSLASVFDVCHRGWSTIANP